MVVVGLLKSSFNGLCASRPPFGWKFDTFGVRILHFDGHDVLATGLFDGQYTISTSSELIRLQDSRVADGL